MSSDVVLIDEPVPQVRRITLNRPEKRNALNHPLRGGILRALQEADADPSVRVMIIRGAGKCFSAGYELGAGNEGHELPFYTPGGDGHWPRHVTAGWMSIWELGKPVIAQVHGWCVGGGSDLALCADLVIASEDAQIGTPYARMWGAYLSGMWIYRLGLTRAKEYALTGKPLSGREAADIGLINEAVPFDRLEATVRARAQQLATIPASQLAAMKLIVNHAYEQMGVASTQTLGPILDGLMRNTPDALAFIDRMFAAAEMGFLRRTGVIKWLLDTGIRPRLPALRRLGIREMHPHVVWDYFTDHSLNKVARQLHNGYTFFLNDGGYGELSVNMKAQLLDSDFRLDPYVSPLPPDYYSWTEYQLRFTSDESRAVSVGLTGITGGLWNGTQRTVNGTLTVKPSYQLRASVGVQRTSGTLPGGSFVRAIWTGRANYSFTTNMFVDALAQYDAERDRLNLNVRFNLIHHPLSNLYLVWNEQRFTTDSSLDFPNGAPLPGRSFVVKLTHMLAL